MSHCNSSIKYSRASKVSIRRERLGQYKKQQRAIESLQTMKGTRNVGGMMRESK